LQAKEGPQKGIKAVKISKAAMALNNAEMGIESSGDDTQDTQAMAQNIMSISSDQMSDLVSKTDQKETQSTVNESAAIAVAKEAAQSYVKDHPDSVFDKKDPKKKTVSKATA
jgi:hypothetical protein